MEWDAADHYHSERGGFTVKMPKEPQVELRASEALPQQIYSAEHANRTYFVICTDLMEYAAREEELSKLTPAPQAPGKLLYKDVLPLATGPGTLTIVELEDGKLHHQLALTIGIRLYQVGVTLPAGTKTFDESNEFIFSFNPIGSGGTGSAMP